METSIVSYPNRGPYGSSSWRGNTSGLLLRDLFLRLKPKSVVDVMVGSGTTVDVCKELGIRCHGLDLHSGFNAVRDSVLQATGEESDLSFVHPPYLGIIKYSGPGGMWGDKPHPYDLSHMDEETFHWAYSQVMLNMRNATKPGGYYTTLVGDVRKDGAYYSLQAELQARMPRDELAAVIIKAQHNCVSDRKSYGAMLLPRVQHEFLMLYKKKEKPTLVLMWEMAKQQHARITGTWKSILRIVMMNLGNAAPLSRIYDEVAEAAPEKLAANPNFQAKVRQVLNSNPELFASSERGVWQLA